MTPRDAQPRRPHPRAPANRYHLAGFVVVVGGMALLAGAVAAYHREFTLLPGFLALVAAGVAALVWLRGHDKRYEPSRAALLRTAAGGWLITSLLGAVPLWLGSRSEATASDFAAPVDALFESVSGFTSTGLTVVRTPADLPAALQFWRSLMEWVGGIGLIGLFVVLMAGQFDRDATRMSLLPVGGERAPRRALRRAWQVYLGATGACAGLYALFGEPAWVAFNHALSTVSTGGFSVTDDGFTRASVGAQWTACCFMILGASSFRALRLLTFRHDLEPLSHHKGPWIWLGLFLAGGVALTLLPVDAGRAWFALVSAATTSGHINAPLDGWPTAGLVLLMLAMAVGGMRGSTAGGLKVERLGRLIGWCLGRRDAKAEATRAAALRLVAGLGFWLAGAALLLLLSGAPAVDVLFDSASALGGVGLSRGVIGPDLDSGGKLVAIALMLLGRLEILPWLLLFMLRDPERAQPFATTA